MFIYFTPLIKTLRDTDAGFEAGWSQNLPALDSLPVSDEKILVTIPLTSWSTGLSGGGQCVAVAWFPQLVLGLRNFSSVTVQ